MKIEYGITPEPENDDTNFSTQDPDFSPFLLTHSLTKRNKLVPSCPNNTIGRISTELV